jgi:hypothetical protein
VTDEARAAEARRVAVAVILAAVDGRDQDLHELVADADRDMLAVAVGGMALAIVDALSEVPPERRAVIRQHLAAWGAVPSRMAGMTPDEQQRLFLGLVLAVHDGNEARFDALLNGVPRPVLAAVMRNLAEGVVGWQVATEHLPGAARDRLAAVALTAAGR